MSRRAFTIIEAVTTMLILSIAVPPALSLLDRAAADRANAVNTARATTLAGAVMESVLADVASGSSGLGPSALDDLDAYLDTSDTGLRDRIAFVTAPYENVGMSWDIAVSDLSGLSVTEQDAVGGAAVVDALRVVTVTVEFPSSQGGRLSMPVSSIVRSGS